MKKKLVLILVSGLLAVSMTACGGGNSSEPDTDTQTEGSQEDETENNDTSDTQTTDDDGETGDKKTITSVDEIEEQYKFVLDGQEYQLMYSKLSDFLNNGWTYGGVHPGAVYAKEDLIEIPEGTELESLTYLDMDIQKDDATVSVRVINVEEDTRLLEECEVASITITEGMPLSFETEAGVSLGDTLSDAKAAYGEYDYGVSEGDTSLSYNFYSSYENYISDDLVLDFNIDGLDEQSLAMDDLRFQSPEGSDVINYIFMEYYPNA